MTLLVSVVVLMVLFGTSLTLASLNANDQNNMRPKYVYISIFTHLYHLPHSILHNHQSYHYWAACIVHPLFNQNTLGSTNSPLQPTYSCPHLSIILINQSIISNRFHQMNGVNKFEVTSINTQHFAATQQPQAVTQEPSGLFTTYSTLTHSLTSYLFSLPTIAVVVMCWHNLTLWNETMMGMDV
jgi:uncharacterized membrane protein YagU involved in acid resistance